MTVMPATTADVESWLAAFARRRRLAAAEPAWVSALRDSGISAFTEAGFPTPARPNYEEWRKTDVSAIARTAFSFDPSGGAPEVGSSDLTGPGSQASDAHRLVFVDGLHSLALSRTGSLPSGVVACPLDEAIVKHAGLVEPHLARLAGVANQPFAALNTAFMSTGFFLHLPEDTLLTEPIHMVFVARTGGGGPAAYHPRHLIVAGAHSRARVVESYLCPAGAPPGVSFTNAVTEILLEDSASIEHVKVQNEAPTAFHVATTTVRQHRASRFTSHSFSIGAALTRNDLNVLLAQERAECELNGLYMAGARQLVDHHTLIDHIEPNCTSRELYKGVLGGQARGVFSGKVIVRPNAHGTDSVQVNRNLLLSEEALVDTKPELQIFNNDVKCRHAATTGQLDEAAMFYLRSRAIGVDEARSLLIHAFVSDVVRHIDEGPTRSAIEAVVGAREAAA